MVEARGAWSLLAGYAVTGAGLVALGAGLLGLLLRPDAARAVWVGGLLAYVVQVVVFGALLAATQRGGAGQTFIAAWVAGTLARFGVVGGAGLWLVRSAAHPPAALLLSLVGFLFMLMLLEGVFYWFGMRSR